MPTFLSTQSEEPAASREMNQIRDRSNAATAENLKGISGIFSQQNATGGDTMADIQKHLALMHHRRLTSFTVTDDQINQTNPVESLTLSPPAPQWTLATTQDRSATSNSSNRDTIDRINYWNSLLILAETLDEECIDFVVTLFSEESFNL